MNTTLVTRKRRFQPVSMWHRLFPEGVVILLLALAVNLIPAIAAQRANWNELYLPVVAVSVLGFACGFLLARSKLVDSVSHLIAIVLGFGTAGALVAAESPQFGADWTSRISPLIEHIQNWYTGAAGMDRNDGVVLSLLLGLITWMVGYLSAWVLFRQNWLFMALLLPGILLMVNLGFAPDPDNRFTFAFAVAGIALAARYHLFRKQVSWARLHVAGSPSLGTRFLTVGLAIAIAVTSIGWNVPTSLSQDIFRPIFEQISDDVQNLQNKVPDWMQQRTPDDVTIPESGSWADFTQSFAIGGNVDLTDEEAVLVSSSQAEYLVAKRYNMYDGLGWSSDLDETFQNIAENGQRYEPAMIFEAGQYVVVTGNGERDRTSATIFPLMDTGNLMFTVDTYLGANINSSVRMSWLQLENVTYHIGDAVPPDLVSFVRRLQQMHLTESGEFGPLSSDEEANTALLDHHDDLASRFLQVTWDADSNGNVTSITVNGQIPVYDDVESVEKRSDLLSNSYTVQGTIADVTEEELQDAGTDYPGWVIERYLELPPSTTARTIDLTDQIAGSLANPYDRAKAIEAWLRANMIYDLEAAEPPDGYDAVDYFLFETQTGYCEHYASAMIVMLRTLGIPARLATGFAPGTWDEQRQQWVYLYSDAHAWVEVYFPGYGWIPFEPTVTEQPRDFEEQPEITTPTPATENQQETPTPTATGTETDEQDPLAVPTVNPDEPTVEPPLASIEQTSDPDQPWKMPVVWIGVLLAVAVLGSLVLWWLWMRKLRGLPATAGLFVRLLQLGRLFGIRTSGSTTPSEYAQILSDRLPVTKEYASSIVHAYELDQYAQREESGAVQSAKTAWRQLRRTIAPAMIGLLKPFRRKA